MYLGSLLYNLAPHISDQVSHSYKTRHKIIDAHFNVNILKQARGRQRTVDRMAKQAFLLL